MAIRNDVQMRAKVRGIIAEGAISPRDVFWTSRERAKHYLEAGVAELIAPTPGPTETKPMEPAESKKFLPDEQDGRSTDSVQSGVSGKDSLSSASRVVPVSPPRKLGRLLQHTSRKS